RLGHQARRPHPRRRRLRSDSPNAPQAEGHHRRRRTMAAMRPLNAARSTIALPTASRNPACGVVSESSQLASSTRSPPAAATPSAVGSSDRGWLPGDGARSRRGASSRLAPEPVPGRARSERSDPRSVTARPSSWRSARPGFVPPRSERAGGVSDSASSLSAPEPSGEVSSPSSSPGPPGSPGWPPAPGPPDPDGSGGGSESGGDSVGSAAGGVVSPPPAGSPVVGVPGSGCPADVVRPTVMPAAPYPPDGALAATAGADATASATPPARAKAHKAAHSAAERAQNLPIWW